MPATTTKWCMRRYANVKWGSEDRLYGTFAGIIPKNGGGFIATLLRQKPFKKTPAAVENIVQ